MQPQQKDINFYWWYARYQINPGKDGDINWPVDLLLADRVIQPVLYKYREKIQLWRFHRRADNDETGHQFSFIFYSNRDTASKIYADLESDTLTKTLLQKNFLRRFLLNPLSGNQRVATSATSDDEWSLSMQKHWPDYIMGVSELWLGLIDEIAQTRSEVIGDMLDEYERVDIKIKELWASEGDHALIHHLHAIFGYPSE